MLSNSWLSRLLKEFKEFAVRGNMVDLAIGIVIGGGFSKLVTSLVNDIIMPPFGLILGKVNFDNLYINLSKEHYSSLSEAQKAGAPTINYGVFLNNVIDFTIVAFAIFFMIRIINSLRKSEGNQNKNPNSKECPFCCSKIPLKAVRCPNCTSKLP